MLMYAPMSMDTTYWRQVRTSEGKIKLVCADEKDRSGRDFIFRILFPGVLAVMTFYRIFVVTPESGEFYTNLAAKVMTRIYIKGEPAPGRSNQQSVSNTLQRSSTGRDLPDSTV